MRLAGVTGHRVFIQDSGRPATGNVPIYTIHRPDLKKPEQVFERIIFGVIFLWLTAPFLEAPLYNKTELGDGMTLEHLPGVP
jgi:hypothetical protein